MFTDLCFVVKMKELSNIWSFPESSLPGQMGVCWTKDATEKRDSIFITSLLICPISERASLPTHTSRAFVLLGVTPWK